MAKKPGAWQESVASWSIHYLNKWSVRKVASDFSTINKAELVVKNLSLKVDATSQVPSDVLTLFNAATGQLIGTMTLTGTTTAKISGQAVATFGQYSFQGTIPAPVTTLLLKTGLNGSTTFAVSQK